MATRSTIAIESADGTVEVVYCHWDGYLDHNGLILKKHYTNPAKVRELIDLGALSSLGDEIGIKRPFDNPHPYNSAEYKMFQDTYRNQCLFYGRDRGEDDVGAKKFANFGEYVRNNDSQEYDYIMRQVNGKPAWFVRCYATHDDWMTIEQAFQAEKEYAD